jgi:hypothetical protein
MLHSAPVAAVYFSPANECVSHACKHRHLLQQKSAGIETGQKHSALFRREHTEGDFGSRRHCWTQGERAGRVVKRGEFEGCVQGVNTFSPTRPKLAICTVMDIQAAIRELAISMGTAKPLV